jgi:hypothetical protein
MSRRLLLLLPALLAAIALPVTPALAGGDDGDEGDSGAASATLRATQGCVTGDRAKATVTGESIDSVAFFLDGNHVKTVTEPDSDGRYSVSVKCAHLRVGAHRARAVVSFEEGASPARKTLRFQITRSTRGTPRFAG